MSLEDGGAPASPSRRIVVAVAERFAVRYHVIEPGVGVFGFRGEERKALSGNGAMLRSDVPVADSEEGRGTQQAHQAAIAAASRIHRLDK